MSYSQITFLLMAISIVAALFSILMLIRNAWVFKHRIRLVRTPDYDRLPSYKEMMQRWWVWDINKFLE